MKVLAGDIGGTKTSLAVFGIGTGKPDLLASQTYPSRSYESLDEIVRHFVDTQDIACDYASFGIAGPVRDGVCETTNLPWIVDARALAEDCGFRHVWLINDLEANAWGISALQEKDLCVLSEGSPGTRGNASVIAAGTGLGEAGLYWDGKCYRPFASEGGHADFAPASELEIALLQYLQKRYPHVSWERVVSGTGLVNIFEFLCDYRDYQVPQWLTEALREGDSAAEIAAAAQQGRCPLCSEAVDLFVHFYGVEAGNHALKIMATGGVFIGGGIAPKILAKLKEPGFLAGFHAKGRMEPLMRSMPVKVILNENTALYGPAVYLATELEREIRDECIYPKFTF